MNCNHPAKVLLVLDCGAGGRQFRRYCCACWQDLEGAIPHAKAKAELGDAKPIPGDLELLHHARNHWYRTHRGASHV